MIIAEVFAVIVVAATVLGVVAPTVVPSIVPPLMSAVVATRLAIVPSDVSEDAVTPEARVAPVSVPAAAATVMSALPLKLTPLMFRAVCKIVALPALPVIVVWSPVFVPLRLEPVTAPVAAIVLLAVTVVKAPVDAVVAPIAPCKPVLVTEAFSTPLIFSE